MQGIHAAKLLSYHFHSLPHAGCGGADPFYIVIPKALKRHILLFFFGLAVHRTDVAFQVKKKSNDGGEERNEALLYRSVVSHFPQLITKIDFFNNKPFFFSSFSAAQCRQEHKQ